MTYEQAKECVVILRYDDVPTDDGKVIVRDLGPVRHGRRFQIESNPVGMPVRMVALVCDGGGLPFGYDGQGNTFTVWTD
jgi:hypothetical protein